MNDSPWQRASIVGIMLLTAVAHFFRLEREGYGNLYYAATVKSMLANWHNFFFASFDPGGFVAVDKPPLGLWIQAASASIFGFNGLSLLLPQAVAGFLSVALLYSLVRRFFGPTAGLIAALILALTPISVAADRNNTMDGQLVFTSLLAAWAIGHVIVVKTGYLRWLIVSVVLVGIGFNIKMLQAFMVLPAVYAIYLFVPKLPIWKRLAHLASATLALLAISLAWPIAVDLTPPDERPFVGSSRNNTMLELILGHNGLNRLLPVGILRQDAPAGGRLPLPPVQPGQTGQPGTRPPVGGTQLPGPLPGRPGPVQPGGPPAVAVGGGSNPANEIGEPGPWRLFNRQLGGQTSWFLLLAVIGAVFVAFTSRSEPRPLQGRQALLFWVMWLWPQLAFFSLANLFHRYYLEMLSPGIAAVAGAGLAALWSDYRRAMTNGNGAASNVSVGALVSHLTAQEVESVAGTGSHTTDLAWRRWLLPGALLSSGAVDVIILIESGFGGHWLTWHVAGLILAVAITLVILLILKMGPDLARMLARGSILVGVFGLLLAPAVWAAGPVFAGGERGLPAARSLFLPGGAAGASGGGPRNPAGGVTGIPSSRPQPASIPGSGMPDVKRLVVYLQANQRGEHYLLATLNANSAAPVILATGQPVMALGGFSGGDRILSADKLAALVVGGALRFFLLPQDAGQQMELSRWVKGTCGIVNRGLWQPIAAGSPGLSNVEQGITQELYDCLIGNK